MQLRALVNAGSIAGFNPFRHHLLLVPTPGQAQASHRGALAGRDQTPRAGRDRPAGGAVPAPGPSPRSDGRRAGALPRRSGGSTARLPLAHGRRTQAGPADPGGTGSGPAGGTERVRLQQGRPRHSARSARGTPGRAGPGRRTGGSSDGPVRDVRRRTRVEALAGAAQLTILVGHMCSDAGSEATAQHYYRIALHPAAEANDPLASTVAKRAMSAQAGQLKHFAASLQPAEAAVEAARSRTEPYVQAYAHAQHAVAVAPTGDRHTALAALGDTHGALALLSPSHAWRQPLSSTRCPPGRTAPRSCSPGAHCARPSPRRCSAGRPAGRSPPDADTRTRVRSAVRSVTWKPLRSAGSVRRSGPGPRCRGR